MYEVVELVDVVEVMKLVIATTPTFAALLLGVVFASASAKVVRREVGCLLVGHLHAFGAAVPSTGGLLPDLDVVLSVVHVMLGVLRLGKCRLVVLLPIFFDLPLRIHMLLHGRPLVTRLRLFLLSTLQRLLFFLGVLRHLLTPLHHTFFSLRLLLQLVPGLRRVPIDASSVTVTQSVGTLALRVEASCVPHADAASHAAGVCRLHCFPAALAEHLGAATSLDELGVPVELVHLFLRTVPRVDLFPHLLPESFGLLDSRVGGTLCLLTRGILCLCHLDEVSQRCLGLRQLALRLIQRFFLPLQPRLCVLQDGTRALRSLLGLLLLKLRRLLVAPLHACRRVALVVEPAVHDARAALLAAVRAGVAISTALFEGLHEGRSFVLFAVIVLFLLFPLLLRSLNLVRWARHVKC
mmetsp:Transcript_47386/g.106590  ORF Transcript_47386/g.106590 Transcript_47386/m.106590 type:complete len:409 (+) Transcript_47386:138-1364(+)